MMYIIGKRIKKLRLRKNLTQKQLAKELNVSKSTISYYEKGERNISLEILIQIVDFFDIDIDVLIGRNRRISSETNKIRASDEEIKLIKELRKMKCYKNLVTNAEEFARIIDYETKDYDVEAEEDVPV